MAKNKKAKRVSDEKSNSKSNTLLEDPQTNEDTSPLVHKSSNTNVISNNECHNSSTNSTPQRSRRPSTDHTLLLRQASSSQWDTFQSYFEESTSLWETHFAFWYIMKNLDLFLFRYIAPTLLSYTYSRVPKNGPQYVSRRPYVLGAGRCPSWNIAAYYVLFIIYKVCSFFNVEDKFIVNYSSVSKAVDNWEYSVNEKHIDESKIVQIPAGRVGWFANRRKKKLFCRAYEIWNEKNERNDILEDLLLRDSKQRFEPFLVEEKRKSNKSNSNKKEEKVKNPSILTNFPRAAVISHHGIGDHSSNTRNVFSKK